MIKSDKKENVQENETNLLKEKIAELEKKEFRCRTLFETTGTTTMLVNQDMTIEIVNQEAFNMTGYKPEELIGRKWSDFVMSGDLEMMKEYHRLRRSDPGKLPKKYEVRLVNKEGQVRNVIINVSLIPGTYQSVVSIHDITERKQIEKALYESEDRYKKLFQFSPDSIIIHDMDMNILDVNNKAVVEFGYSKKELLEMKVFDLHHETELKHSAQVLAAMKKKDMLNVESKFVRKDGSVFWAEAAPRKYTLGSKTIIHVAIRDITERKQAEEELSIAKKRLNIATSILRHDVTNDLVVIKSALDIYQDQNDKTMLDEIEKRVEKSLKRINMHREHENFVESYKELEEYDLVTVLNEVTQNYPGIKIAISGTGEVYADDAIYSVFENIINNAIKHGNTKK